MTTLVNFYRNTDNMAIFLPIVEGRSRISLRLIDWLVTNYSKAHNVIYPVEYTVRGITRVNQFIMHASYKSQLRAYSKQLFDPFRRGDYFVVLEYEAGKTVETTVGQLSMFRWLIVNKVIHYLLENLDDIEADMTLKSMDGKGTPDDDDDVKADEKPRAVTEVVSVAKAKAKAKTASDIKVIRRPLSISANRTVHRHECVMTVTFD